MLVELPTGEWINALDVEAIRFGDSGADPIEILLYSNIGTMAKFYIHGGKAFALTWAKEFAQLCNSYKAYQLKPNL